MAKSLILYPYSDVQVNHSKSASGNQGYSLINEASNSSNGYIQDILETDNKTLLSTFSSMRPASNISVGKIRLNSITSVNLYLQVTKGSNATLAEISIYGSVAVDGTTYTSQSYNPSGAVSASAQTLSVPSNTIGKIYTPSSDDSIEFTVATSGYYTTQSSKNNDSTIRIYNANVTVSYDDVFECKAEIVSGVGIVSATTSAQDVVDGDVCTFTAAVDADWRFVGWFDNSDFSGDPVSTSATYTTVITKNTTLYPKAETKYDISVYGDTTKFSYTCSSQGNKEYAGEIVTITVTPSKSIYKYSGIYKADINGNKLSEHITNDNPYTFTMPADNVRIYVEIGKEVKVYVNCVNCSLSSGTSPVVSSSGKTETISLVYDTTTSDWSGIYQDPGHTIRLTGETSYTFVMPENDVYLYAKAIGKQQIYVRENGTWQTYSGVYVKENGQWVRKDDYEGIFDALKNYVHIKL